MLVDLINKAKITYKKGKRGSYIVGHRSLLFNIQPENFCFTDYNIQVINSSRENLKLEKLRQIVPEFIGKGSIADDVLLKVTMSDSITEVLEIINGSLMEKAKENDAVQQLSAQLEELKAQLKQYENDLQEAERQLKATEKVNYDLKVRDLDIREKESIARIRQVDSRLTLDNKVATEEIIKDKMVVQLEREQLYAEGTAGNAKEVKNNL
jgi:outer membrane murein-binding lipoprotein Lpp